MGLLEKREKREWRRRGSKPVTTQVTLSDDSGNERLKEAMVDYGSDTCTECVMVEGKASLLIVEYSLLCCVMSDAVRSGRSCPRVSFEEPHHVGCKCIVNNVVN